MLPFSGDDLGRYIDCGNEGRVICWRMCFADLVLLGSSKTRLVSPERSIWVVTRSYYSPQEREVAFVVHGLCKETNMRCSSLNFWRTYSIGGPCILSTTARSHRDRGRGIVSFYSRRASKVTNNTNYLVNMFHEGDLQSGVALAVQQGRSVLCFVKGRISIKWFW